VITSADPHQLADDIARRFEPNPYATNPVGWTGDKLGEHMWSRQREICESVVHNRHTAVQSAHGTGKSYTASRLVAWWLDSHPIGSAFAVTTAPTQPQVNAILWREIRRAHNKGDLSGRVTLDCHWYMGDDELVAFGRKPADYQDEDKARAAFQGIHGLYVLFILDEACGIPTWLWDAVESQATNEYARVLAIGNPDDPATEFYKVCQPGSGWNQLQISAYDIPGMRDNPDEKVPRELGLMLTGPTWIQERIKRWGQDSPLFKSKVLGEFPEVADDVLISPAMIRKAVVRELDGMDIGRGALDVARFGADETVAYRNRGGVVRREWRLPHSSISDTTDRVRRWINEAKGTFPVWIDTIGYGAGVFDPLAAEGFPVRSFDASQKAHEPTRYKNRRAEQYWALRQLFEDGAIDLDPEDEDVHAQLGNIKWKVDVAGRIQIEAKEDIIKRSGVSPDRADTVMMSTCDDGVLDPEFVKKLERQRKSGLTDDLLEAPT
jgi:hypothetical protein